jgi:hypothetical protein
MRANVQRKNYRMNVSALRRAQRSLRTQTETETIHKALEMASNEVALAQAIKKLLDTGKGRFAGTDEP